MLSFPTIMPQQWNNNRVNNKTVNNLPISYEFYPLVHDITHLFSLTPETRVTKPLWSFAKVFCTQENTLAIVSVVGNRLWGITRMLREDWPSIISCATTEVGL